MKTFETFGLFLLLSSVGSDSDEDAIDKAHKSVDTRTESVPDMDAIDKEPENVNEKCINTLKEELGLFQSAMICKANKPF